jgi:hypothetical protein
MGALIGGLVAVALGVWGILLWTSDFLTVIKGSVPLMIALGGLLAVIAGITTMKDAAEAKKLEKEGQQPASQPEQKK